MSEGKQLRPRTIHSEVCTMALWEGTPADATSNLVTQLQSGLRTEKQKPVSCAESMPNPPPMGIKREHDIIPEGRALYQVLSRKMALFRKKLTIKSHQ